MVQLPLLPTSWKQIVTALLESPFAAALVAAVFAVAATAAVSAVIPSVTIASAGFAEKWKLKNLGNT